MSRIASVIALPFGIAILLLGWTAVIAYWYVIAAGMLADMIGGWLRGRMAART